MSGNDFSRTLGNIGTILTAFADIADGNSRSYNTWDNCISNRPVYTPPIYTSPVYIPTTYPQPYDGCYGNQRYSDYRSKYNHSYRHKDNCQITNNNYPRYIPSCYGDNDVPGYSSNQTGNPGDNNPAYPVIAYGGNGQQRAIIRIAGRELEFDQATGSIASRNLSNNTTKYFSNINNPNNNNFSEAEKQQIRNGQPVERYLGDEKRAKIYFYPSSDRASIENVIVYYDNQKVLEVGNLGRANGLGLNIPPLNNQYNSAYNQSQTV